MVEKKERNAEIVAKKKKGATDFELAQEYGVHPSTIRQIVQRDKVRTQLQVKSDNDNG